MLSLNWKHCRATCGWLVNPARDVWRLKIDEDAQTVIMTARGGKYAACGGQQGRLRASGADDLALPLQEGSRSLIFTRISKYRGSKECAFQAAQPSHQLPDVELFSRSGRTRISSLTRGSSFMTILVRPAFRRSFHPLLILRLLRLDAQTVRVTPSTAAGPISFRPPTFRESSTPERLSSGASSRVQGPFELIGWSLGFA